MAAGTTPRARTIILTDASTVVFDARLAGYDGTVGGSTPVPAPFFSEPPEIVGTLEVGQTLTAMDGTILNATSVSRRWVLGSVVKSTAVSYLATSIGELVLEVTASGPGGSVTVSTDPVSVGAATGTPTPPPFSAAYAQGMGATADDGMVASIPLPTDAKRMYLDTRAGSGASDSYNGLSPYPGFKLNGTGADGQYGATGKGMADAAYGPKLGFVSAETALGAPGIGHQVCLAEGGIYADPTAASAGGTRLANHYGKSASQPYVIQSYDPADPTNEQKMGRARGPVVPKLKVSTDNQWNFNTIINNGGGTVSNFAARGLRFVNSDGLRAGKQVTISFENMDGSNFLFENLDCGGASIQINNTSETAGDTRWSRNLIIRKCLLDRCVAPGSKLAAIHTAGWAGITIEDCIFTHNGWSDTVEDRYATLDANTAVPTFFLHDNYNAGSSQWPNVLRRNVSLNAAATFASNRNNLEAYNNVVINAPIAGGAGGGVQDINVEQPNGNYVDVHHNFSAGSQPLQGPKAVFSANPTGGYVMAGGFVVSVSGAIIGSTVTQTIDNVVAALNASTRPYTSRVTYRRFGMEIRQTMKEPGTPYVVMSAGGDPALTANEPLPRSFPFGLTGPVAGSEVHHNLSINSGYLDGSENMFVAPIHGGGMGANGVVSYGAFHDNKLRAWSPTLNPANVDTAFYHGTYVNEDYQLTSPYTNKQVWQAMGYADETALEAAMIADHTQPWALRILAKAKELFGHEFEVPTLPAPVLTVPAPSTLTPKVGDTVTFPNPTFDAGTIVSAATYVDNIPVANSGKPVNTLVVTSGMLGKRLSRMVVVKGANGAPSATAFYQIDTKVAAASGGGVGKRFLRLRAVGSVESASYASSGNAASLSEVRFKNGGNLISTAGWTTSGDQIGAGEGHANLIDGDINSVWTGAFGQTSTVVFDRGPGTHSLITSIEMEDRHNSTGRAPGEFYWDDSDDGTTWTQTYYQKVSGNYPNDVIVITPLHA